MSASYEGNIQSEHRARLVWSLTVDLLSEGYISLFPELISQKKIRIIET